MKKTATKTFVLVALIFSLQGFSQMTTFRFSYDLGAFDIAGGMVQSPAGEFVIAGLNNSFGPYYGDAMKIDAAGNVVWAKAYTAGFATNFSDIKNVSTGGYIITGSSTSGGGGALLVRIDAAGAVLWAFRYQLPNIGAGNSSNEYGNAVIETSDGGFLVGGGVDYFWDGISATTVDTASAMGFKVNSAGTLQWSKVWTITTANPDEHYINDVAESADGYFFVGQSSEGSGTLSSNGDYPSNSLIIKTTTAGTLTYIRRWGAGNTTSQGINSALRLTLGANAGKILLGGFDDIHGFLITVEGVGAAPTMGAFNRRINGAAFPPKIMLIQDIMENSDGNYSVIGTQIEPLTFAFYTIILKINSSSGALIFGRGYAPIGLSSILPEGGLCTDQGYYVSVTDQQATGFNFNVIRTNTLGQTNDPAAGCPGTSISPGTTGYTTTLTTPASSNYNLMTSSSFVPTITNMAPTRLTHCFNAPAALSATSTFTNLTCNAVCNGTASVTASGGTAPYTYLWSPSGGTASTATGLCANNYTCTITDNVGATTTQSFAITQPTAVTATQSQTNLTCNAVCNGTASVVAAGGVPGYTYSWSPSGGTAATATGLCATNYTCTITDANGCPITKTFLLTQPPAITASATSTQTACTSNTGTATTTASGGTGVLTYSWAPSGGTAATANNLAAGNYTCTVTDANGCTNTATVNVSTVNGPAATLQSQVNVSCFGGSNGTATVNATGGTPGYTYLWSPSGGTAVTGTGLSNGNYTCTITDAAGCTTTQSVAITQPTTLVASAASQTNISCNAGANGAASVTVIGGTSAYAYNWTPGNPTGDGTNSVTGLTVGTWTCTVTDANSCTTTQTFNITQPTALVVSASAQTNISCNGGATGAASVTASGGTSAYSYNWTPGNPAGDGTSGVTGLTAGSWTCTVTDANGCTGTQTFSITQPASALSATQTQTNVSCNAGCNGTAGVTAAGGTSPYTYSWSPSGGTSAGASGLCFGNYTCTITDANGCSLATNTFSITQPSVLSATATSTQTGCSTSTGSATASPSGGTGPYTYSWAPSGGTAALASNLGAGNYTCTITDANGCTTAANASVSSATGPALSVQSSSDITCFGSGNGSATISATGSGPFTYAWSPSGGTAATATNLTANTYSCTVIDVNGCSTTQTVTINEPTVITASASSTPTGCSTSTGSATVVASGGTGALTYSWAPSGGTGATENNLAAGVYTVTITDANGCTTTANTNVSSTGGPVTGIQSVSDVTCFGGTTGSGTISSTGNSPFTYSWSPSGGTAATATGLGAGTYSVSVTDINGCVTIQTVTITEPTQLISTPTSTAATCGNNNGTADAAVTGGTGPYTYLWSNSLTTATLSNLAGGSYSVTVTDANGCTTTSTVVVANNGAPVVTLQSSSNLSCFGGANGSATVNVTGGSSPYTYAWTPSGGTAASATGLSAGTYTVTVTGSDGCTQTQTVTLTQPTAIALTNASSPENCGNADGVASVGASGGTPGYTYLWSNASTNDTISNLAAGSYSVTATDANGCTTTTTVVISNVGSATADAGTSVTITSGQTTQLNGTGGITYSWSPATGLSCTNCQNPVASPTITTIYTLTVTDSNGCTDSDTVTVVVDIACGEVYLPNAFSPNGDFQNDVLYVRGNCIKEFELQIYNRWGEKVFVTSDITIGWDGTWRSVACEAAVFTYVLNATLLDGTEIARKGNISLVK